ncbi:MAG: phage tail tube protein, partial [Acidimicrobiia bacterium]
GDGIITDPDAGTIPVGAHKWVFDKRVGAQAKSAQLEAAFGDANAGAGILLRGQGFGVTGLSLNAAGALTAEMTGLLWKRVTGPVFDTPAYDSAAIPPILMSNISLTWLANSAKASDFSLGIGNPLVKAPDLSLNPQPDSPALLEADDQRVRLTGSIAKRILDDEDLDTLIAGTTFSATAKWKSTKSIGGTAYKYTIWVEMPACQYNGADIEDLGNKRRHPASFPFKATLDEATGRDVRITLVNAVTAISTFA